uniref:Exonuclease V n=1 Tax=Geladintestivirus 2 TaxID=3233134 RepID=A0AAU8MK32_9CAUD
MKDTRYDEIFLYFKEEGHKYNDSNGNSYSSVTTLIHDNYVPKFNKAYWLRKKSKELGITAKQLAKQWQDITDEACTRGTITHNGIEDAIKDASMFKQAIQYLNNISNGRVVTVADIPSLKVKPLDIEAFKQATNNKYEEIYRVFQFYVDKGYTIYSEIGVFLIDYLLSGTIDILCIRDTDFVILDWKTNRNGLQFTSGYFRKDKTTKPAQLTNEYINKDEYMLPPLNYLPNCNGYHYTMQLSMYARMVELILGIPCVGLGLCHIASPFIKNAYGMPYRDKNNQYPIDPNGVETVKWHRINYKRKEADLVLADRLIQVKSDINNKVEKSLFD